MGKKESDNDDDDEEDVDDVHDVKKIERNRLMLILGLSPLVSMKKKDNHFLIRFSTTGSLSISLSLPLAALALSPESFSSFRFLKFKVRVSVNGSRNRFSKPDITFTYLKV